MKPKEQTHVDGFSDELSWETFAGRDGEYVERVGDLRIVIFDGAHPNRPEYVRWQLEAYSPELDWWYGCATPSSWALFENALAAARHELYERQLKAQKQL